MKKKMLWRSLALAYLFFFIGRAAELKEITKISFNGQAVLIVIVGLALFIGYKAGQEKKDNTRYFY